MQAFLDAKRLEVGALVQVVSNAKLGNKLKRTHVEVRTVLLQVWLAGVFI